MTEKIKAYLDELFSTLPQEEGVKEAKEELYAGMVERYNDYLREGMDEQEAYDAVIDSVGDIKELFDELPTGGPAAAGGPAAGEAPPQGEAGQNAGESQQGGQSYGGQWYGGFWEDGQWHSGHWGRPEDSDNYQNPYSEEGRQSGPESWGEDLSNGINDIVNGISDFASGLMGGLFTMKDQEGTALHNSQTIPLEGISTIEVGYVAESIEVGVSPDENLVINEYFRKGATPPMFARIQVGNGRVQVKNGNRLNFFYAGGRVEVLLPASWVGSLQLSTIGGSIKSDSVLTLSSLQAKTVSGHVGFLDVSAGVIRLVTTSGSVQVGHAAGNMEFSTVSGTVKVEAAEGNGNFKSTSGSVRVFFRQVDGPVTASTISGGVRLGLPETSSYELDARSISGSIHTAFDGALHFEKRSRAYGFIGEAPHYSVRINTTSGGIHIND